MKRKALYGTMLFLALASLAAPFAASAYTTPTLWPTGYWATGGLISCTGNYSNPNSTPPPCQSLCDLIGTIINIIYFAITICFFVLAPILFAVGGIMIMISGANPEMMSRGKKTLAGTVIGVAIVLCAYLIVATFVSVLNISKVGGFNTSACSQAPSSLMQRIGSIALHS